MTEYKYSRLLSALELFGISSSRENIKDPLAGIDIEKEAELIKIKESNLSANMREMVMRRYEKLIEQRYKEMQQSIAVVGTGENNKQRSRRWAI